uniref:Uncharacterized protein n=1 Tax=Trichuris muris TaxID=70415 RepID=A0A5S6R111_TRIMR
MQQVPPLTGKIVLRPLRLFNTVTISCCQTRSTTVKRSTNNVMEEDDMEDSKSDTEFEGFKNEPTEYFRLVNGLDLQLGVERLASSVHPVAQFDLTPYEHNDIASSIAGARRVPKDGWSSSNGDSGSFTHQKFRNFIRIEQHPNGLALVVQVDNDQLSVLSDAELEQFAKFFLAVTMSETDGVPNHVMGIIRNGARSLPNFFEYFAHNHPELVVKTGSLTNRQEVHTVTMGEYAEEVRASYNGGTFRAGPLLALTLVDTKQEESGGYFPNFLNILERSPFLQPVMPWGSLSSLSKMNRRDSNDGPILWIRPGEQYVPTGSAKRSNGRKRRREGDEQDRVPSNRKLKIMDQRAVLFEDRTHCHADHVDGGLERKTTAAVAVLKAVHGQDRPNMNRVVKEAVCFHAADFERVVSQLNIDVFEPPMTQCREWVDVAKLNQLRQLGIRYAVFLLQPASLGMSVWRFTIEVNGWRKPPWIGKWMT